MTEGKHGYVLTSPGSELELCDALDKMADDRARLEMAAEARVLGRQQTFDRHVERLLGVFEEAARSKKGRALHSGRWAAGGAAGPHVARSKRVRHSSV